MMNIKKILLTIIILSQISFAYNNDNDTTAHHANDVVLISEIIFSGNNVTRENVLANIITFKVGDALDITQINTSKIRLMNTRVFDDVEFIIHYNNDYRAENTNDINDINDNNDTNISIINNNFLTATIEIKLKESLRIDLDYGISYRTHMYGVEKLWFEYSLGVIYSNLGGRLEELRVAASVWDYKAVELSWYKPLLPSRYFLSIATGVDAYPANMIAVDYTDVYVRAHAGRMIGAYSRVFAGPTHIYRQRERVPQPPENQEAIDRIPEDFKDNIHETFFSLAYSIDRREHRFNPRRGWFTYSSLATNYLNDGGYTPFFQLTNEARYYIPFLQRDALALRFKHQIRDVDAGQYHRMTRGSVGEVRGYSEDELGWDFTANSNVMLSAKYNKHLYTTPRFPMPLVDIIFSGVENIRFRFDVTFIADYLRLYEDPQGAITNRGDYIEGVGLGGGVRIMIPEIRQSGCIDLVYGLRDDGRWSPNLHIYLDVFF